MQRYTKAPPELANQAELLLDTTNAEEVGEKQQVLQVFPARLRLHPTPQLIRSDQCSPEQVYTVKLLTDTDS